MGASSSACCAACSSSSAFLILLQFSYLLKPGVFILLSYILYKGVHRHLGSPIS